MQGGPLPVAGRDVLVGVQPHARDWPRLRKSACFHETAMRACTNLCQTCWANAALQVLAHCPQLARFCLTDRLYGQACRSYAAVGAELPRAVADFLRAYWRGENLTPVKRDDLRRVVALMSAPGEEGYPQDAHETVVKVLHAMHDALREDFSNIPEAPSRKVVDLEAWEKHCAIPLNGSSVLMEMFQLQIRQTVDGEVSHDHPWELAVPPGRSTREVVEELLDHTEEIGGRVVRRRILYLPLCLLVSGTDMLVDPFILAGELGRYEAVALASIRNGHWVASAKERMDSSDEDMGWWFADDDVLTEIDASALKELRGVQLAVYRRI